MHIKLMSLFSRPCLPLSFPSTFSRDWTEHCRFPSCPHFGPFSTSIQSPGARHSILRCVCEIYNLLCLLDNLIHPF